MVSKVAGDSITLFTISVMENTKSGIFIPVDESWSLKRRTSTKAASIYLHSNPVKVKKEEVYYHTDGINFYFIMSRKEENVFNIKVNK